MGEPHYSLRDLAEQDGVLESHLEGLQLAGDKGWQLAVDELKWEEPGEVFVAAVLALESNSRSKINRTLETVGDSVELRRALISALGWLPWNRIETLVGEFAISPNAFLRYTAVAAFEIHRRNPDHLLAAWLDDDATAVQSRALQAVGTLARTDLLDKVAEFVDVPDEELRFHASWTTALRKRNDAVISNLLAFARAGGTYADPAARLLASVAPVQVVGELINQLARCSPRQVRLAIILSGLLGLPDSVPWLIEMMKQPEHARVAGESFSRISGLRLDQRPFEAEWPEGFEAGPNEDPSDENVEMDPDENLPFPEASAVAHWWEEHAKYFQSNTRYLLGWEIANPSWLHKILILGRQRERATAGIEWTLLQPLQPLFEIRANGNQQIGKLSAGRLPTEEYRCYALEAGPEAESGGHLASH